jgi:hypothetical protein
VFAQDISMARKQESGAVVSTTPDIGGIRRNSQIKHGEWLVGIVDQSGRQVMEEILNDKSFYDSINMWINKTYTWTNKKEYRKNLEALRDSHKNLEALRDGEGVEAEDAVDLPPAPLEPPDDVLGIHRALALVRSRCPGAASLPRDVWAGIRQQALRDSQVPWATFRPIDQAVAGFMNNARVRKWQDPNFDGHYAAFYAFRFTAKMHFDRAMHMTRHESIISSRKYKQYIDIYKMAWIDDKFIAPIREIFGFDEKDMRCPPLDRVTKDDQLQWFREWKANQTLNPNDYGYNYRCDFAKWDWWDNDDWMNNLTRSDAPLQDWRGHINKWCRERLE